MGRFIGITRNTMQKSERRMQNEGGGGWCCAKGGLRIAVAECGCGEGRCGGGRSARGFTLSESMVAVTVLAIGVVAVVGAVNTARSHEKVISDSTEALSLGRQLLEEISSKPFDDPDGVSAIGPEPLEN